MPFISELMPTAVIHAEFADSKFNDSFAILTKPKSEGGRGYGNIRRLRRDGNCFYRSFLYQLFEHYARVMADEKPGDLTGAKEQYKQLLATIEGSKKDMVDNGGYDEIVLEDFYDIFLENV